MLNNESFFNSEEEKLEQKLSEFNAQNTMRMKYACDFKNQELINKDGNLFLIVD